MNVLEGKLICSCEDPEISDMLSNIFLITGLKEKFIPCKEEKNVLVYFIRVNYPNKTLDEFTLAFNLALTGKLDLNNNEVKLFDIFSCQYLGTIMGAYGKWLKEVYYKHQEILSYKSVQQLPAAKTPMHEKDWKELLDSSYKYPFELIPTSLYDHFAEKKKIVLNEDQKFEYLGKAADYLDIQLRKTNIQRHTVFLKMKTEGFTGSLKTLLKDTSKRLVIWERLMKRDIELLLQPEKKEIKQLNDKSKPKKITV